MVGNAYSVCGHMYLCTCYIVCTLANCDLCMVAGLKIRQVQEILLKIVLGNVMVCGSVWSSLHTILFLIKAN